MRVILNIGLDQSPAGSLSPDLARHFALGAGFQCDASYSVHMSDTEPTLVISANIAEDALEHAAHQLCRAAKQEAIAVLVRHAPSAPPRGLLLGPKASNWGAFDPKRFILPDGTRLH